MKAYEPCHDEFLRYCSVVCYGRMEVEDLIQDVLLSAFKNFDSIHSRGNLLHYLIKAARNRAITEGVKQRRQTRLSATFSNRLLFAGVSPETLVDVQIIYDSLKLLPENQATALWLYEVQGLKMKEIASIMDTTEAAVKMNVSRARKKIRHILSNHGNEGKRHVIIVHPICKNEQLPPTDLEVNWVKIVKEIPPQIELSYIEGIVSRLGVKSLIYSSSIKSFSLYISSTMVVVILLLFFFTEKRQDKTKTVPKVEETQVVKNKKGSFTSSRKEKATFNPPLFGITGISSPSLISAHVEIPKQGKNTPHTNEAGPTLVTKKKNYGEFSISGHWKSKRTAFNDCLELTFSEFGTNFKTNWKFKECFKDHDFRRQLRDIKGAIALDREAGQVIFEMNGGKKRGVFKFRPNPSFQALLSNNGFTLDSISDLAISVSGSSQFTGRGKPVLTSKQKEVLWLKMFLTDINIPYINFLNNHGYTAKDMQELWKLGNQEVGIDYLKEIVPYRNTTVRPLTLSDIAELKAQGVSPLLVQQLWKCEIDNLSVNDLVSINQLKIPLEFIDDYCELPLETKSADNLNVAYLNGIMKTDDSKKTTRYQDNQDERLSEYGKNKLTKGYDGLNPFSLNLGSLENSTNAEIIPLGEFDKLVINGNLKVGIANQKTNRVIVLGNQEQRQKINIRLRKGNLHISSKPGFQSKSEYDLVVLGSSIQDIVIRGNAKPLSISIEEASKDTLTSYIKKVMSSENIVGYQALVIKNGNKVFELNEGFLKSGEQNQVNENSVFMIASLVKPIYALALMRLVDRGLIDLDKPINTYLNNPIKNPNFPNVDITPRMLLSHTSGIKDNWEVLGPIYHPESGIQDVLTINRFIEEYLRQGGMYFNQEKNFQTMPPGKFFEYSNIGYMLIGHLIEQITSLSIKELCRKEVLIPLGMEHTYWYLQEIPNHNIASPHTLVDNNAYALAHYGYPSFPEGQIRSTTRDYSKLISVFLNKGEFNGHRYLSSNSYEEFMKVQNPGLNTYQLMAWNKNEFQSEVFYAKVPRLPAHTGLEAGATSACLFDPNSKAAVVIFSNTQPYGFEGLLKVLTALCHRAGLKLEKKPSD